jgi:hypothetical protein
LTEAVIRLRRDLVEWREVDGEIVALDLARSLYLAVNRTGALLWPAVSEGTTRERLVEMLVSAFALDPAAARADVDAFLADLERQGLLEQE